MSKYYCLLFYFFSHGMFAQLMGNSDVNHSVLIDGHTILADANTFVGNLIYDGKLYQGQFIAEENIIIKKFLAMDLNDRRLTKFDLVDENGNRFHYDRNDKKVHGRKLFDELGMQAYDRIIYFPNAKPDFNTLVVIYQNREIKYIDNVFRMTTGDVKSFINRCKVDGEQKAFLREWLLSNLPEKPSDGVKYHAYPYPAEEVYRGPDIPKR